MIYSNLNNKGNIKKPPYVFLKNQQHLCVMSLIFHKQYSAIKYRLQNL